MDKRTDSGHSGLIFENAVNIALNAGYMAAQGRIRIPDAKEFPITVQQWAEEFEIQYGEQIESEAGYIGLIDSFSEKNC
ncbi:hypothetical protein Tfer_0845 [Thermincola ferriacetica]|uniref:Uncharacterized protein n=1 Tax=Thermincola ferriacetica TaxID=281456 RepID=A0A0L6W423_9FIRM|nr:hypothetical protein [Thermincola ferriacetica]KNZ70285.1 hypothetical protein Tfer_0845 [Thermincola ferriacetica]